MKMSMRWYGKNDAIPLKYFKQIPGVTGIVSAVYDVKVGEAWPEEAIKQLVESVNAEGLTLEVIESVPVHEDIKLGRNNRFEYIENYKKTLRLLAKYGVKVVCYNFMPIFDWTRSDVTHRLLDGSETLVYYNDQVEKINPLAGTLNLPGWDSSYQKDDIVELFRAYENVTKEDLWENLLRDAWALRRRMWLRPG